jgi:hypothetical protein
VCHVATRLSHHTLSARLRPLVRLALYDERKAIHKEGVKLLRAMLFSLSYSYPTDYRAWAPSVWKASAEKDAWLHWGSRYSWSEIEIQWHIPVRTDVICLFVREFALLF